MEDTQLFIDMLKQGQEQRKKAMELHYTIVALFVSKIQNIDDVATLERIKKELLGNA